MPTTTQVQTQDRACDPGRPPEWVIYEERVRELLPDGVLDELLAGAALTRATRSAGGYERQSRQGTFSDRGRSPEAEECSPAMGKDTRRDKGDGHVQEPLEDSLSN